MNILASQNVLCKKSAQTTRVSLQQYAPFVDVPSKGGKVILGIYTCLKVLHYLSCDNSFWVQFLGMEFCNGNYVALLAAPERLFASSDAKRARLHKLVVAARLDSLVNEFRRDVLERGQPWQE